MRTNINDTPQYSRIDRTERVVERDSGINFLFGIILAILLGVLLFAYGLPYLRGLTGGNNVIVPDQIQVDVNGSAPTGGADGNESGSGSDGGM